MERVSFEPSTGAWVRFDGYEIRDGLIRPRSRSEMFKYDPWALYRELLEAGEGSAPYVPLIAAVDDIEVGEDGKPTRPLKPREEDAILAWCRQYGLLGVLPHEALSVTLAARWDYVARAAGHPEGVGDDPHQMALQVRYLREGGVWKDVITCNVNPKESIRSPPRGSPPELIPAGRVAFDTPKVVSVKMGQSILSVDDLGANWARHFPAVPPEEANTYLYPCPGSASFWKLYAEPVEEFVGAVVRLKSAMGTVGARGKGETSPTAAFAPLVGPVGMAVEASADSVLDTRWIYPTLLASLSGMVARDLSAKRRLRKCEAPPCANRYVSTAWQSKYCSTTCGKRMEMRAYRKAAARKQRKAKASSTKPVGRKAPVAKGRRGSATTTGAGRRHRLQ